MAFLLFAIRDNYRAASPLPTGKAGPRPCCSPLHSGAGHDYNLGLYGPVVSASHSESLAIGWAGAWHHGKFLDLLFGVIWLRAIKGKIPKIFFFFFFLCMRRSDERLFPGIFESILAQLLKGNFKVSFPLCMKKAHIYVPWVIANNITCSQMGLCMFSSSLEKGVVRKQFTHFSGIATDFSEHQ